MSNIKKISGKLIQCIKFCVLTTSANTIFFYFRGDQFMEDLQNKELNRELRAFTVSNAFESWSPETQEQVLAVWNT